MLESAAYLDSQLADAISQFVTGYTGSDNNAYFVMLLPHALRLLLYSVVIIILFLPLKLIYPYSAIITGVIYIILALAAVLLFGVFIGFFQLLWTS
jgi:hypothetical protein